MPLPPDVETVTVTVGTPFSSTGRTGTVRVEVRPLFGGTARRLIWSATGDTFESWRDELTSGRASSVSLQIPYSDQPGFVDPAGNPVTMWPYEMTVVALDATGVQTARTTKLFTPLSMGPSTLDFDLIITEDEAGVVTGGSPIVLTVNGHSGPTIVLTKADIGLPLVDNTPDNAKPVSTAQAAADTAVQTAAATDATTKANAAQAAAIQRSNHTGFQTSATISDFTEAAQDAVAAALAGTTGATVTYNDAANTITITGIGDPETMRDTIGAALVGVGVVTVTVNDSADTITISSVATQNSTDAALRDRSTHTGTQSESSITGLVADLAGKVSKWQASTAYVTGDVVMAPDGSIVRRLTSGTSGASYTSTNWQTVATVTGTQAATELDATYVRTADQPIPLSLFLSTSGDQTANLQAAIDAAAAGSNLEVAPGRLYRIDGQVNITKPVTILSRGYGGFYSTAGTTAQKMFNTTSAGVHFHRVTVTGPQFATNAEQYGLWFAGTSGIIPLTDVSVTDCRINSWGKNAIRAIYITNFTFDDSRITDCAYAGIGVLSAVRGSIDGNYVQNITQAGTYPDSYGIFTSRNQTTDFTVDPRSARISISGNQIYDVPRWDGINTHAGSQHVIANNIIENCFKPIEIVGCVNSATGNVEYAPFDIKIIGNDITGDTTAGSDRPAITFVGAQGVSTVGVTGELASGIIANNTIRGHGSDVIAYSGAIRAYYTRGLIIANNELSESSPCGILLYHDNYDFSIIGNTFVDPWSNLQSVAAGVYLYGDYNSGVIDRNSVIRGDRTATAVLTHGVNIGTGNTHGVVQMGRNSLGAATTPFKDSSRVGVGSSMAGPGVGLLSARPVASSAYADKWYIATDVLSGTLYYCQNQGSGVFAWIQAGSGVVPDDGLWRPRDNGFIGASVDPSSIASSQTAMVSQTQYVTRVKVDQAGSISKCRFYVQTAGTAVTEGTATVYDSSGAQLCTQDASADFAATSLRTLTFGTPSRAVAVGEQLFVILRCTFASGTAPVLRGVSTTSLPNASGSGTGLTGSAVRYGTLGTGVTSAPASITVASIVASAVGAQCHWVGLG